MSVTGPSANTNAIQRLSELELEKGIIGEGSWHNQYKDSCYIFIGGLDTRMTEGDIIIVFSQFGEPIDINLKRDKTTGKSLGYCFLGYKDQRSTILAVDNFNGSTLLGRRIRVDHVMDYSAPVIYEDELDEEGNKIRKEYKPTGAEGAGIDKYYVTKSEQLLKETKKLNKINNSNIDMDEDERWALEFENMLKKDKEKENYLDKNNKYKDKKNEYKRDRSYEKIKDKDDWKGRKKDRYEDRKHNREERYRSRSNSRNDRKERKYHYHEEPRSRSRSNDRYYRYKDRNRR